MEKKTMYALTFCYEACNGNEPYASTIAISDDIEKLKEKMNRCVEEDCRIDEEDEYNEECNYKVVSNCLETEVVLQHISETDLYTKYHIHFVEVI